MRICCAFLLLLSACFNAPNNKTTFSESSAITPDQVAILPVVNDISVGGENSGQASSSPKRSSKLNSTKSSSSASSEITVQINSAPIQVVVTNNSSSENSQSQNSASVAPIVQSPVNGGWQNNDIRSSTFYVAQKSCTSPMPANGGLKCPDIAGWKVFNAGGFQLARTCIAGGTNGRMLLANGEYYFWCDPPEGFNHNGTSIGNVPAPAGQVADMTQYWPWPVDGTAFVKIYQREVGNSAKLIQKHTRDTDGTYLLQDVYYYPDTKLYEWHSTWHYRLDTARGVVEFRDDVADVKTQQLASVAQFSSGNEILHGYYVSKGTEVTNVVQTEDNLYLPGSHMWFKVFEIYSNFSLLNKNYKNVVAMNIKQFFCLSGTCDRAHKDDYYLDYTHFYLAPYIGFVKHVYFANNPNQAAGEANLVQYCTTSKDKWSCD